MLCCLGPFPYYSPIDTHEDEKEKASLQGIPSCSQRSCYARSCFPGLCRSTSTERPPRGSFLIKTGGNALQAIPRDAALDCNTVAVSVPENVNPGQEILVTAPDGSGRCMRATVPEGALPGHTFLVKMETPPVVVMAIPVGNEPHDLLLTPESNGTKDVEPRANLLNYNHFDAPQQQSKIQPHLQIPLPQTQPQVQQQQQRHNGIYDNRVLVQVPLGVAPGSKIRVKIPDGRVIEATVPQGEVTQFYVKVPPKKQNWHDNPAAYAAPMVVAPFLL